MLVYRLLHLYLKLIFSDGIVSEGSCLLGDSYLENFPLFKPGEYKGCESKSRKKIPLKIPLKLPLDMVPSSPSDDTRSRCVDVIRGIDMDE